jgi:hypothetical protein
MEFENIVIHPHALQRLTERGASENEVILTVRTGEQFIAKHGRSGFRLNFIFNEQRNNKYYAYKQVEAFVVNDGDSCIVITVIVKFF